MVIALLKIVLPAWLHPTPSMTLLPYPYTHYFSSSKRKPTAIYLEISLFSYIYILAWSVEDVMSNFLEKIGLSYTNELFLANKINGKSLMLLREVCANINSYIIYYI